MLTPIESMQRAVDIVLTSPHPSSKIAASLCLGDVLVCRTNDWPERIASTLGKEARIGESSGTVHAEIGCLLSFPAPVEGASLYVTDPFCPNCAKGAAEAGVRKIYIDHKGFTKDFAERRGDDFGNMSLRIAQRAGISVYEIRRKEGIITPILTIPDGYIPPEDNPIEHRPFSKPGTPDLDDLKALIRAVHVKKERWACGFAMNAAGGIVCLVASLHAAIGYSEGHPQDLHPEGKYSFFLEPINRLLMGAARYGYKMMDGLIWSAGIPTSREQVNMIAAGLRTLHVGNREKARNAESLLARDQVESAGLLAFPAMKV